MDNAEPTLAPESTRPPAVPRGARLLLAGVAIAALAALLWPRSGSGPKPGGFLVDAGGRPAPLAAQLSPVTLLHFWSTWCPPCVEEAPAINRLAAEMAGERDFRVLMVAVEDDITKVSRFPGVDKDRVLYDPKWEIAHRYGTRQLPESHLLVDGKVVRKWVGATAWDDPEVRAILQDALAQARAAD